MMNFFSKMLRFVRQKKADNRGLTLVELVCTMAILGLISASVASVMVVSAKNYQRGTVEAELQQTAQLAVNQIEDLIIDATTSMGSAPNTLRIVKANTLYEVELDSTARKLLYSEYIINESGVVPVAEDQLLAENVDVFTVDASNFATNNSMLLHMELSNADRSYAADFTITARNGSFLAGSSGFSASISVVPELVLEPGESYAFPVTVNGNLMNKAVNWTVANNTSSATEVVPAAGGKYQINVGLDETAPTIMFTVSTQELNGVTPYAWQTVKVNVRRVNSIDLVGSHDASTPLDDTGAVYNLTVNFPDANLEQKYMEKDLTSYVDPRQVRWEYTVTDLEGNVVSNPMDYITIAESGITNVITFRQSMQDYNLIVKAIALHPDGTSRTLLDYGDVSDVWTLHFIVDPAGNEWARTGYSPMFLRNIDPSILHTWGDGSVHLINDGPINMKWWRDGGYGWESLGEQGNQGGFGGSQSTDLGIKVYFAEGKPEILYADLEHNHRNFSYSTPYFRGDPYVNYGVRRLRLILDLGGLQSGMGIFQIKDVVFEYRNSQDAAWTESGTHKIYVTPSDSTSTYTTYFRLLDGWDNTTNQDYVAFNRFVGVIRDEPGTANDAGYDLTFLDASGNEVKRQDVNGNAMVYGQNFTQISAGSAGTCTLTVKVSDEEKATLCAGTGTVIREIYEYNPWFNSISGMGTCLYDYLSDEEKARVDAVDGCEGVLEFHFVQPNVQITNHASDKPAVMYCPSLAELGGTDYYYINDVSRYHLTSDTTASYETNVGGAWTAQYGLTWNGSMWVD